MVLGSCKLLLTANSDAADLNRVLGLLYLSLDNAEGILPSSSPS